MAFYSYNGDVDHCYSTPYNNYGFDSNPIQFSSSYSPPEPYDYNYSATPLEMSYSVYTHSEPKIIQYDPIEYNQASYNYQECYVNPSELVQYEAPSYDQVQFYSPTKFRVSYSVSPVPPVSSVPELDDTSFDEYDPTPYDGGYDQVTTYGRPLPPSDKICYPRRTPPSNPVAVPDKQKDEIEVPAQPQIEPKPDPVNTNPDPKTEVAVPVNVVPTDDKAVADEPGNGNAGDYYGYGRSDRQAGRIPYGSGLESMDLCETLFGYWPCVAKRERDERLRQREDCDRQRRDEDPWNTAADYLFGGPVAYGYEDYPQLRTLYQE